MVDYKYADLYTKDSVDKQVHIEFDGGTITNTELFSESIELSESLCSESELRFGCCETSSLKFKVANVIIPLHDKWLTVTETLGGNTDVSFSFGKYKVFSDKPTADRKHREIVAYDAMYDILNADVADWYNTVLPNEDSVMPLKKFRTLFIERFGLEQEDIELINDDMPVFKTIEPSEISGKDVITAICEINGCFGHIGRDGKFHYVYLEQDIQGLYPADDLFPADDLYPRDPKTIGVGKSLYISCKYEDYLVRTINKLQIRKEENDIGVVIGDGDNSYVIEDNFLVYGKGHADLLSIGNNVYSKIRGVVYRPFEADCKGNPCLEVGDAIRLPTKYEIVESYILKRTLKGIQALRDTYSSDGTEFYTGKVNGVQKSLIQLKGKTNTLSRTVEETKSTITDVEEGLHTEIVQTADKILLEAAQTYETKTDAEITETELISTISQTASEIKSTVASSSNTWDTGSNVVSLYGYGEPTKEYSNHNLYLGRFYLDQSTGKIYQAMSSGWVYFADAKKITDELYSEITQTAEKIELKVDKNGVISSINQTAEEITIDASKISLNGAVTANNNVKISTDGKITAKNANIEGKIKSSSATITGGTIHIETEKSNENIIQLHAEWDEGSGNNKSHYDLAAAMGSYGFRVTQNGLASILMYHGLDIPNGGYLKLVNGVATVGASVGYIGTLSMANAGVSGTLTLSAAPVVSSDRRLKNDIRELDRDEMADFIYSLVGYEFKYNNGTSGRKHHGLIAQQLKESMGERDWGVYMDGVKMGGTDERYMAIRYEELIADLIATAQSQNERIKKLEEREEKRWSKRIAVLIGKITQVMRHHLTKQTLIK